MVKRTFDIVFSLIASLCFSPVIAVCCVMILREDRHAPVLYKQVRIGKGGRPFTLYKFRSMRADAEQAGTPVLCQQDDDRITPVGKFLRDHHLDEFPQLWNVLRGDMSFVGPRPEREYFVKLIMEQDSRYEELYALRPGLFSKATLYNGYTDTMEKMLTRLQMDLDYLHHRTFLLDLKIIWLTAYSIISGKKF